MESGSTESSSSTTKINLKLLVDKSKKRVLFAEAGKDFVDFLFGILELPIGAIINLLVERGMETSWPIAKVYEAVRTIDPIYLELNQTKLSLLNPKTSPSNTKQTPMLQQFGCIGLPQQQYVVSSTSFGASSRKPVAPEMVDGYVKGMVTYMVMDDLTTKPISTISCITTLHTFQIKDIGCLEEKTVEIDIDTALRMVKASFESSNILTEMFVKPEEISIVKI